MPYIIKPNAIKATFASRPARFTALGMVKVFIMLNIVSNSICKSSNVTIVNILALTISPLLTGSVAEKNKSSFSLPCNDIKNMDRVVKKKVTSYG